MTSAPLFVRARNCWYSARVVSKLSTQYDVPELVVPPIMPVGQGALPPAPAEPPDALPTPPMPPAPLSPPAPPPGPVPPAPPEPLELPPRRISSVQTSAAMHCDGSLIA